MLDALNDAARREGKKGGGKGGARAKGTKGKRYGAGLASADAHVMTRIAEVIQGMKEDFIVVHLQEPCSFCRAYISDAPRCAALALQQLIKACRRASLWCTCRCPASSAAYVCVALWCACRA